MRFLLIIFISFFVNASVFAVKPLEDYQFESDQWKAEVNRYLDDRLDQARLIYAGEKHVKTLEKIEKELAFLRECFERGASFQHPQMSQVQQQQVMNLTGNRPCEEAGLLFTPIHGPYYRVYQDRMERCKRAKRESLLTFLHHENEDGFFTYFGWGTAYSLGVWLLCYVDDADYIYEYDCEDGDLLALSKHDVFDHLYEEDLENARRNELADVLSYAQTPEAVEFIGSYYHERGGYPVDFMGSSEAFQRYFVKVIFGLELLSKIEPGDIRDICNTLDSYVLNKTGKVKAIKRARR